MLIERIARALTKLFAVLIFLEVLSWATSSIPPCLMEVTHEERVTYNHNQSDCPAFSAGSIILLSRFDHFMERHDKSIVASFTIVLAISTIGLWLATVRLWQDTKMSAEAAKASAEHIPRVERAYVSGGANRASNIAIPESIRPLELMAVINNYGKTPAFIGTVQIGTCFETDIDNSPDPQASRYAGFILAPNIKAHESGISVMHFPNRVVFGRIWYRDIFNECHSAGFVLRTDDLSAVAGHDAYWEDRPERDLGPAAHE